MLHPARVTASLCLLLLAAPPLARAQSGTIAVGLISIEGHDPDTLKGELAVGIADCESDAEIVFELDNLPDKTTIAVFVGDDCTSVDRTNPELSNCELVADETIDDVTSDLRIKLGVADLVSAQGFECDSDDKASTKLWFLGVDSANSREDVGTDFGFFPSGQVTKFETDLRPPEAPGGVSGGSGENQIPIEWDTDDTDLERFLVYADSNVGSGGSADGGNAECNSSRLRAGASAASVPDSLRIKSVNEGTATGTTIGGGDIDGDLAAVAVVAVDTAGNESPLSEVVCVHVVPTDGFWDVYERDGGDVSTGCPCTAMGPAQLEGSLPIALALGWLGTRRRRRRR